MASGMKDATGRLRAGAGMMNAFLSLPAYRSFSSSEQPAWIITAGPSTVPLVLPDHACGTASMMKGIGETALKEKRSFSQPCATDVVPPPPVQLSSCTFARPHDFIWVIAHT